MKYVYSARFFNLWLLMERRMHIDDDYKELQWLHFFQPDSAIQHFTVARNVNLVRPVLAYIELLRNGVLLTA